MRSALPPGYNAHMVVYKAGGEHGYEIRSLSRGAKDPCSNGYESWHDTKFGRITIRNCSAADSAFVNKITRDLEIMLQTVEVAFGKKVHIDAAQYSLVDTIFGFDSVYEHRADPMHLAYVVTESFNADDPEASLRSIIAGSAHELFHLSRYVLDRYGNGKGKQGLDEEGKAAFFAKCVEGHVLGSMTPYQVGSYDVDPAKVESNSYLHGSATGTQAAARLLAPCIGPNGLPPNESSLAEFGELCFHMVD